MAGPRSAPGAWRWRSPRGALGAAPLAARALAAPPLARAACRAAIRRARARRAAIRHARARRGRHEAVEHAALLVDLRHALLDAGERGAQVRGLAGEVRALAFEVGPLGGDGADEAG